MSNRTAASWPSRKRNRSLLFLLLACSLAPTPTAASASEPHPYTAQNKPRIAVIEFADTNAEANSKKYGPSVSAMLVTFFKRQSQFIVVERQDVKALLDEWDLDQQGATSQLSTEARQELFEKIDVILQGNVTLLAGVDLNSKIEIDAKLLSVEDGRIVTAARGNGSLFCLRQIVDRLGNNLEQDFLRPYYGKLAISYKQPENTNLYLTPVLRADALEEEKPPIERGSTLYTHPDGDAWVKDEMEEWVTQPTTYTIESLLSGWYTLRLERRGYLGRQIGDVEVQAVPSREGFRIEYRTASGLRWARADLAPPELLLDRLLVFVPRLETRHIEIEDLELKKIVGSRQILAFDEEGKPLRGGRVLLRSLDLDINPNSSERPNEDRSVFNRLPDSLAEREARATSITAPDDAPKSLHVRDERARESCDFSTTKALLWSNPTGTVVPAESTFDLASFRGGFLALEDYRGESIPTGTYEAVVWSPHFALRSQKILVRSEASGDGPPLEIHLRRERRSVQVVGRLERPVQLVGEITGLRKTLELEPRAPISTPATSIALTAPFFPGSFFQRLEPAPTVELPVDRYRVTADLGPFGIWTHWLDLLPTEVQPPTLEDVFPGKIGHQWSFDKHLEPVPLELKDGLWTAGRDLLLRTDSFYDTRIAKLLDPLLDGSPADRKLQVLRGERDVLEDLSTRLEDKIDLLVLGNRDLERLRQQSDLQEVIRRFLRSGHAVLAFATAAGSYGDFLGAPLEIRKVRRSKKLSLYPGQVRSFQLQERMHLGTARPDPRVEHKKQRVPGWRVLAFEKKGKRPKILERGPSECGGYVLVWLEDSEIRSRWRASAEAKVKYVEDAQAEKELDNRKSRRLAVEVSMIGDAFGLITAKVSDRAVECATRLMHQRLGGDPEIVATLCEDLETVSASQRTPQAEPCRPGSR